MIKKLSKLLIYGIGNSGRQDDGLGWAFVDEIEKRALPNIKLLKNYQLQIEDSDLISDYKNVLFVDATKEENVKDFRVIEVKPSKDIAFTTHAFSIENVLALCQNIYGNVPSVHTMEIKGYKWDLKEGLTSKAQKNLEKAIMYFEKNLYQRTA